MGWDGLGDHRTFTLRWLQPAPLQGTARAAQPLLAPSFSFSPERAAPAAQGT